MNDIIQIADKVAEELHRGQTRKDGTTPYITHPRAVKEAVRSYWGEEPSMLAAALLHDVIEDCNISANDLLSKLCDEGAEIVEAAMVVETVLQLTSLDKLWPRLKKEKRAVRKKVQQTRLYYSSAIAIIIKVCDRLDNLKGLSTLEKDFQEMYKAESTDLFMAARENLRGIPGAGILLEKIDEFLTKG